MVAWVRKHDFLVDLLVGTTEVGVGEETVVGNAWVYSITGDVGVQGNPGVWIPTQIVDTVDVTVERTKLNRLGYAYNKCFRSQDKKLKCLCTRIFQEKEILAKHRGKFNVAWLQNAMVEYNRWNWGQGITNWKKFRTTQHRLRRLKFKVTQMWCMCVSTKPA